jgi:hypothetical protein
VARHVDGIVQVDASLLQACDVQAIKRRGVEQDLAVTPILSVARYRGFVPLRQLFGDGAREGKAVGVDPRRGQEQDGITRSNARTREQVTLRADATHR